MKKYIIDKIEEIISNIEEPEYESISVREFLIEYDEGVVGDCPCRGRECGL